ncbi:GNAT family N-acetyltransferase [Catenulispora rubra]|uniref:GNAT family N-acetyltransferase n=1 Tax=Catenulispora rubra TaxID=280293 RepID=UPI0018927C91|nr:GNAT family N-acetyltransferase [Catenulispora rubra]
MAIGDDGALLGFLAATVGGSPGSFVAKVRLHQHAACGDDARMTYRHMYRALSEQLVEIGCFEHTVAVAVDRPEVVNAFVELSFGFDQIKGLRSMTPPDDARAQRVHAAGDVVLRAAVPGDLARIVDLTWELQQFHAEAPMLRPAVVDMKALRGDLSAGIADENRLVLLAEHEARVAGLMVVDPDGHIPAAATIGIAVVTAAVRGRALGTALLSGAADWAATRGFRRLCAGWTSANLVSDAFWRGHGFVPVRYTLTRRIDPRVKA